MRANPTDQIDDRLITSGIQAIQDYQRTLKSENYFQTYKIEVLIMNHFGQNLDWREAGRRLEVQFRDDSDDIYRVGVTLMLAYKDIPRIRPARFRRKVASDEQTHCQICDFLRPMTWAYFSEIRNRPERDFQMGSICINLLVAVHMGITYAEACQLIKNSQNLEQLRLRYKKIILILRRINQTEQINSNNSRMKIWKQLIRRLLQKYQKLEQLIQQNVTTRANIQAIKLTLNEIITFNNIFNHFNTLHQTTPRSIFRFRIHNNRRVKREFFQTQQQYDQITQYFPANTQPNVQINPQVNMMRQFLGLPPVRIDIEAKNISQTLQVLEESEIEFKNENVMMNANNNLRQPQNDNDSIRKRNDQNPRQRSRQKSRSNSRDQRQKISQKAKLTKQKKRRQRKEQQRKSLEQWNNLNKKQKQQKIEQVNSHLQKSEKEMLSQKGEECDKKQDHPIIIGSIDRTTSAPMKNNQSKIMQKTLDDFIIRKQSAPKNGQKSFNNNKTDGLKEKKLSNPQNPTKNLIPTYIKPESDLKNDSQTEKEDKNTVNKN